MNKKKGSGIVNSKNLQVRGMHQRKKLFLQKKKALALWIKKKGSGILNKKKGSGIMNKKKALAWKVFCWKKSKSEECISVIKILDKKRGFINSMHNDALTNLRNRGLISEDRSSKATLLFTIPRSCLSRLHRIYLRRF